METLDTTSTRMLLPFAKKSAEQALEVVFSVQRTGIFADAQETKAKTMKAFTKELLMKRKNFICGFCRQQE